jgi:thiosulfate/3-mercaptopyruvate sulfurtransferase
MTPLVSTDWLAERLDDPTVKAIDGSWVMVGTPGDANADFVAGHIPGAVHFDIDQVADHSTDLPHMLPTPQEFATAVRRMGIEAGDKIVIYDTGSVYSAARVWWTFRAMGHREVAVLDGGLPKWVAEGHPVETGWPDKPHAEFKAHLDESLVRDAGQVKAILSDGSAQVVDARPAARFRGEAPEPRAGLRGGHMPGALNTPAGTLIRDGRLLPPEELRAAFEAAGVDLDKPLITTCGSGVTASLLALALGVLGREDVAVYDGSWSEWGRLEGAPVVTGA